MRLFCATLLISSYFIVMSSASATIKAPMPTSFGGAFNSPSPAQQERLNEIQEQSEKDSCESTGVSKWINQPGGMGYCEESELPLCADPNQVYSGGLVGGRCVNRCGSNQLWQNGHKVEDSGCICIPGTARNDVEACTESAYLNQHDRRDSEDCGGPLNPCPTSLDLAGCREATVNNANHPCVNDFVDIINAEFNQKQQALNSACDNSSKSTRTQCQGAATNAESAFGAITQILGTITNSVTEALCADAAAAPNHKSTIDGEKQVCTTSVFACNESCSQTAVVFGRNVEVLPEIAATCETNSSTQLTQISSLSSEGQALATNITTRCNSFAESGGTPPEPDPPGTTAVANQTTDINPTPNPVVTETDGDGGDGEIAESNNSPGSAIAAGLGQLAAATLSDSSSSFESFKATPGDTTALTSGFSGITNSGDSSGSVNGGAVSRESNSLSLGGTAPGGDPLEGLPDDPRITPQAAAAVQTANTQRGGGGGSGQAGRGATPGSARLSSSDGGSNYKRRGSSRRGSVQSRNLINGYKNVRAADGGGSLSIKPSDMKRYGTKTLKAKLNAARQKYGVKVPLMFKNGKFVRDFLAMKEAKGFKSRHAAMEGYWKGNSRQARIGEHDCVGENQCHTNVKANIFKIMNLRLQKSLHKTSIGI